MKIKNKTLRKILQSAYQERLKKGYPDTDDPRVEKLRKLLMSVESTDAEEEDHLDSSNEDINGWNFLKV